MSQINAAAFQQANAYNCLRTNSGVANVNTTQHPVDERASNSFAARLRHLIIDPSSNRIVPIRVYVAPEISSEALYRPPSAFQKVQMAPFAIIKSNDGTIEVSNAGYVCTSFDSGGDPWWLESLDAPAGPARATEIARRLAARFGGEVRSATTAVTQQAYDAMQQADVAASARPDADDAERPARFFVGATS